MTTTIITGIILLIVFFILCLFLWLKNSSLSKTHKELKESHKTLKEQSQINQDFISSLSQELRIPLYGIMGLTNLLAEEQPDLENNKNLKSLKFSGDYLLTLINNILQVNDIDAAQINPIKSGFNLKNITYNIVNSFSYATKHKDNTLHFDYDPAIASIVYGDSAILSQLLMNLISNALRFTRNGNVYFSVNLIKSSEHINTVSFTVKHDGNEITKEDKKSIFEEFVNIDKDKKSYLGTGLNATIVKRLATSLGGEIILEESSNTGSAYVFVLDFELLKEQNTNNTIIASDKKYRALVVDDNKLNLLVADKILSKENFDCTTVDNGFDAIELVKEQRFDIILMDINMPKLNGIGTTKRIRQFDNTTPIIALTAVDVTQLNRQILQAGLNNYILKPYDKNLLMEMIYKYVSERKDTIPLSV